MFGVAVAALAALFVPQIDGHGFMYTPRTRNYIAFQDGVDGSQAGSYSREHCKDCLNTNVGDPLGYCGFSGNTNVDYTRPIDSVGQPMPWTTEITYVEGTEIVIEHTYTAHHYGHIEIAACPLGPDSTWECFENPANFLEFVSDELYGMPKDPNYPERGYLKRRSVGDPYKMIFKLPVGVNGDQVLLRWHYITANSCLPNGYDEYFTTAIANGEAVEADRKTGMTECVIPYERTGLKPSPDDPEQFWNCAEIAITPANPTKSPAPSVSPAPTKAPVTSPEPTTAPPVVPNPNGMAYPCCSWDGQFCEQPDNTWCHESIGNCEGACNGEWKDPTGGSFPPPTVPSPTVPAPPTSIPTTGIPCCSNNFKHCITWECNSCHQSEEHCLAAGNYFWMPWGEPIDDDSCIAITYSCVGHGKPCCAGMICNPDTSSAPCIVDTTAPSPPTTPPPPTDAPTPSPPVTPGPITPTLAPTASAPVTPAPTGPPTTSLLFSSSSGLSAYDAFLEITIDSLTQVVQQSPPVYALVASGGAAGQGDVVSESQAYALLTTGIVLASWDEQSAGLSDDKWDDLVTHFEGYYNGWKAMCLGSSASAGCQSGNAWCYDETSSGYGVCLPGWKHSSDFTTEVGTGAAPDGDVDAILGMILAIKAFEGRPTKPSFYDELRKWADASCSSFLYHNTVVKDGHRLLKLGSCWGGFGGDGNNPSYHSPGSFKALRDYHVGFVDSERSYSLPNYGSGSLEDHWNQLIATSYETLEATQCPDFGMVPNWATVDIDSSGSMYHTGGSFSGSGTPQWEYGSEAARTTWRVAIDAALFPSEMNSDSVPYLNPILNKLEEGYNPGLSIGEKYFDANLFTTSSSADDCFAPGTTTEIYPFSGGWIWNSFIYAPTVSAAIAPVSGMSESNQQAMVDHTAQVLSYNIPTSYFSRCWTVLALLTINGSVESAGKLLAGGSSTTPSPTAAGTSPPTAAPITLSPTKAPVDSPTSSPTKAPVDPPTLSPTKAPTDPITPAPTDQPSASPSAGPTTAGGTSNGIPLPCCGWGNGCEQPDNTWCQEIESQCTGACNGVWYTSSAGTTSPPTPAPTSSGGSGGCCTWGGWSTCPSWTQGTTDPCQLTPAGCANCSGSWIEGTTTRRQLRGGTTLEV